MSRQEDIKKIERRARSLLVNKEIPPQKQEVVRTLLNNKRLDPLEKYRTIIDIVQTCPDKKPVLYHGADAVPPAPDRKKRGVAETVSRPAPSLSAPTETSYFVDDLLRKHAAAGLFRKRYLVHRNNRLGIGLSNTRASRIIAPTPN
jgi:hypothetical protein